MALRVNQVTTDPMGQEGCRVNPAIVDIKVIRARKGSPVGHKALQENRGHKETLAKLVIKVPRVSLVTVVTKARRANLVKIV